MFGRYRIAKTRFSFKLYIYKYMMMMMKKRKIIIHFHTHTYTNNTYCCWNKFLISFVFFFISFRIHFQNGRMSKEENEKKIQSNFQLISIILVFFFVLSLYTTKNCTTTNSSAYIMIIIHYTDEGMKKIYSIRFCFYIFFFLIISLSRHTHTLKFPYP